MFACETWCWTWYRRRDCFRLLVAQGNHGIHLRCPPSGDIRCGDGDRRQEDSDAGEDDPIARVYAVKQARHDLRQSQPSDQADANSSKRGDHSLTKNKPQYVFTLRAERQANTDLSRASQDRVRNQAVQADHGENQGKRGEATDQIERIASQEHGWRLIDDLLHRPRFHDGQLRVQPAQYCPRRTDQCRRVLRASNDVAEEDGEPGILVQGKVHDRRRRDGQTVLSHISNDTDNLAERFTGRKCQPHALADGITPSGVTLHPRLVDDGNWWRVRRVRRCENPARYERDLHDREVVRSHAPGDARLFLTFRGGPAFHHETITGTVLAGRQSAHRRDPLHSRQVAQSFHKLMFETKAVGIAIRPQLHPRVRHAWEIDAERQYMLCIEPRVLL